MNLIQRLNHFEQGGTVENPKALLREAIAEIERRGEVGREFVASINRVLDLHFPMENSRSAMYPEPQCAECHEDHPCPTVRALELPEDPT